MERYEKLRQEFMNESFRKKLREKLGCKCVNCEAVTDIEYHHIIPLALGGTNKISNIVPLCYACHQLAHGSRNIRQLCRAENTGRPKLPKPDNADDILWDYMCGRIGGKQCREQLGLKPAMKLTELWYFREFLKENHIIQYKNKVDLFNCKKNASKGHKGQVIALVKFEYGEDYVRYAQS